MLDTGRRHFLGGTALRAHDERSCSIFEMILLWLNACPALAPVPLIKSIIDGMAAAKMNLSGL